MVSSPLRASVIGGNDTSATFSERTSTATWIGVGVDEGIVEEKEVS
jgi:hypothetical protein